MGDLYFLKQNGQINEGEREAFHKTYHVLDNHQLNKHLMVNKEYLMEKAGLTEFEVDSLSCLMAEFIRLAAKESGCL